MRVPIEDYMSYNQYFAHSLMDMCSILGTLLMTVLNHKSD